MIILNTKLSNGLQSINLGSSRFIPFNSTGGLAELSQTSSPTHGFIIPSNDVTLNFLEFQTGQSYVSNNYSNIKWGSVYQGYLNLIKVISNYTASYAYGMKFIEPLDDSFTYQANGSLAQVEQGANLPLSIGLFNTIVKDVQFSLDDIKYICSSITEAILSYGELSQVTIPNVTTSSPHINLGGWEWGQGNEWQVAGWFGPASGDTAAYFSGGNQPFHTNAPFGADQITLEQLNYPYIFQLNNRWNYGKIGLSIGGQTSIGWFTDQQLAAVNSFLSGNNYMFFYYQMYYEPLTVDLSTSFAPNSTARVLNSWTSNRPTLSKFVNAMNKSGLSLSQYVNQLNFNFDSTTKIGGYRVLA